MLAVKEKKKNTEEEKLKKKKGDLGTGVPKIYTISNNMNLEMDFDLTTDILKKEDHNKK